MRSANARLPLRALLAAVVWLACAAPPPGPRSAATAPPEGWRELRARHFTLYTDLGPAAASVFAEEVQFFLALAVNTLGLQELPSVPISLYAFAHSRDFERFREHPNQVAIFFSNPDHPIAAVDSAADLRDVRQRLFHELAHYLMAPTHARQAYPLWYSEGLAELLSSADRAGARARLGIPPLRIQAARAWGRWIALERLLATSTTAGFSLEEGSLFYAESWALVHDLHAAKRIRGRDRLPQLLAFLAELRAGRPPSDAATRAFGTSIEDLELELRDQWDGTGWRSAGIAIPLASLAIETLPAARALDERERDAALAELRGTFARTGTRTEEPIDLGPVGNPFRVDPPAVD